MKKRPCNSVSRRGAVPFIAAAAVVASGAASAFQIDTGNPDVRMTWDNTVKYSAGWRVRGVNSEVADNSIGPQANTNDGDLNFDRGLISNRLDLLSELDVRFKRNMGFRLSGAAWYDQVYNESNDNPGALGGALVNQRSAPYNEFTRATKQLHGRKAEFLDAFVYGNLAPSGMNLNLKAGRFTQLYGESLFFGSNGIAGAQTPLDLARALSVPNSQFKEVARPVGQISGQLQINADVTLGAYYQMEWRKSRLPAAGSYFSFADFVDAGVYPKSGRRLRFRIPTGHEMHLYAEKTQVGNTLGEVNPGTLPDEGVIRGMRIYGLDHVFIVGPNMADAARLFAEVFEFDLAEELVDQLGGNQILTFFSCSSRAHDIAFGVHPEAGRFHHVSFRLNSTEDHVYAGDLMGKYGIPIEQNDRHGITAVKTIYFFDPSGNRNEIFVGGHTRYPDSPKLTWTMDHLGLAAFSQSLHVPESFLGVTT
ncbi:DUF1302 family protein [Cognatazoarcus halotolerans]|uniref:DUF1302 family protein n=1 Tax=Cognatazoarcus halotolerans TaxID=2686016 RepID=UPI001F21BB2E|nr:DUF1302 family protein [Cognatazoarcus halotolerans]